jgi:hypothetical protein
MRILEDDEHGMPGGEARDLPEQRRQGLRLALLRGQLGQAEAFGRQHQQLGDVADIVLARGRARQQLLELGELGRRGIPGGKARRPFEMRDDGMERPIRVMRRAEIAERIIGPIDEPLLQRADDARLADARLARQQHHAAVARLRLMPVPEQQLQLALAADQRHQARGVQRLEPALEGAGAQHLPGPHLLAQAAERDLAEIAVLEEPAGEQLRRRRDQHLTGFGHHLQPGRQVRHVADHAALLCRALADEVADDDDAGGDADANLQPGMRTGRQPRDRLHQGKGAAHRAFGIVLMRLRIAEIGQHAIAHVLRDEAPGLGDHPGAAAMIGADDLPHVFGIEPRRERGRAHEVAEHDGELAPFGRRGARRGRRPGRGGGSCCPGCAQRLAAFPAKPRLAMIGRTTRRAQRRQRHAALAAELAAIGNLAMTARALHPPSFGPGALSVDSNLPPE